MESLKDLLSPIEPARFLSEYYFRKPLHIPGDAKRFSHLLSWDDLNRATTRPLPRRTPLRLAKDGKQIPKEEYAVRETSSAGDLWRVKFRVVRRLLEEGCTLLIDRIDERHEPLADLCRTLEVELGDQVFADAFASWHQTQGFSTHWDAEQVLVLQLKGTKRWRVLKPEWLHPTREDKPRSNRPPSEPYWEGDLKPGDLLYIPGGWWHDALAVSGPTLHVSISLHATNGITVLNTVLSELREDELVRTPLPRFASEAEQRRYMSDLRDVVDKKLRGLTVKSLAEKIDASAPVRNRLSLPWNWAPENEAVAAHAWVHWLPPRHVVVREFGAQFNFQSMGNEFAFSLDYLPMFRDLMGCRKARFSELCSRHPQLPAEKILLELVSFGLVAISDNSVI
ncbi:MAG TPA: cupin domain-containing protein [Rhizomicrobium sp.]|nr:cupin domain-containing protein [Rhizomicrobium sp.]